MARHYKIFINGEFCDSVSGETMQTINPFDKTVLGSFPACNDEDVDRAVCVARQAFSEGSWPRLHRAERASYLRRIAQGIKKRARELATIETMDSGKPLFDNLNSDIPEAARCFEYFADLISALSHGNVVEVPFGNFHDYTVREPIGVVGLIAPWNFPLVNAAWKIAPAISAGNCVIYKPAEETVLSTLLLAEIIQAAELPAGVVNIITGLGSRVGKALTGHPGVDKISFTGSTETGRAVLDSAADTIKDCLLELGGKSPNIVFRDSDLKKAVDGALWSIFSNAGQTCTAGSRLLLQDQIYDEFMDRLERGVAKIKIGDPMDMRTRMGPLVSAVHYQRVIDHIEAAINDGALLRTGGCPAASDKSYFISPTIFENVRLDMRIDQDEVFGPVLVVHRFTDEEDAIRIANHTDYGLAAGIWTNNLSRAFRIARQLEAGTVWINTFNIATSNIPFAGFKQSGIGIDSGREGFEQYTRLKNVCIDLSDELIAYFDSDSAIDRS